MAEKIYPKGIRAFSPRTGAPDFVKGSIVISPAEFRQWMNEIGNDYLRDYKGVEQITLDLVEGSKGLSLSVNTYKKQ